MHESHEWHSLNFNGSIVRSCKWCFTPDNGPDAKEPCAGRSKIEKEVIQLASKVPVIDQHTARTLAGGIPKVSNVADLVRSLNVTEIEGLIAEHEGEVAGLKVLLAAAKARDKVT